MQKPSFKWFLIFNLILDLAMSVVMSITAPLLNKAPLVLFPDLVLNIVIGFVLAFLINLIVPIPKVSTGFAGLFGIRPHTLAENLVGGIPVCLIFTAGISFPMTAFNLFLASRKTPELTFSFQVVSGSFLRTFLPLFGIMYVVSFIMIPVAATCANKACRR